MTEITMEQERYLTRVSRGLKLRHLKTRRKAVKALISLVGDVQLDISDHIATKVSKALFADLDLVPPHNLERLYVKAVEMICSQNHAFRSAFSNAFKSMAQPKDTRTAAVAVKMGNAALRQAVQSEDEDVFQQILLSQAPILQRLLSSYDRVAAMTLQHHGTLLRCNPYLAKCAAELVVDISNDDWLGLLASLCLAGEQRRSEHIASVLRDKKTEMLGRLSEEILTGKRRVLSGDNLFSQLYRLTNHEDIDRMCPHVERGVKAATEDSLCACRAVCRAITIDMSRHAESFFLPLLGPELSSKFDRTRLLAVDTMCVVLEKCSDADALGRCLDNIVAAVTIRRSSVPDWKQRVGVATCLRRVGGNLKRVTSGGVRRIASAIVPSLSTAAVAESHPATKEEFLLALSVWLQNMGEVPEDVLDALHKGCSQSSHEVAYPYVRCVEDCVQRQDCVVGLQSVANDLLRHVEEGASKPHQVNPTAVRAVTALLRMAAVSSQVSDVLKDATVPIPAASGTSVGSGSLSTVPTPPPAASAVGPSGSPSPAIVGKTSAVTKTKPKAGTTKSGKGSKGKKGASSADALLRASLMAQTSATKGNTTTTSGKGGKSGKGKAALPQAPVKSALTAPQRPFWGLFTSANSFLFASQLVNPAGKTVEDTAALRPTLVSLVHALEMYLTQFSGTDGPAKGPVSNVESIVKDLRAESSVHVASQEREAETRRIEEQRMDSSSARSGMGRGKAPSGKASSARVPPSVKALPPGAPPRSGSSEAGKAAATSANGGEGRVVGDMLTSVPKRAKVSAVCKALVALLLHPVYGVRDRAAAIVGPASKVHKGLPSALLSALVAKLEDLSLSLEEKHGRKRDPEAPLDKVFALPPLQSGKSFTAKWRANASDVDGIRELSSADASGTTYPSIPAPHLLRFALSSLVPDASTVGAGGVGAGSVLGAALGIDVGTADSSWMVDALAAALLFAVTHPLVSPVLAEARLLWCNVYCKLSGLAGYDSSSSGVPQEAFSDKGVTSLVPSFLPSDRLLQMENVQQNIIRHLLGPFGLWSPSHLFRTASQRSVFLLVEGSPKPPRKGPTSSGRHKLVEDDDEDESIFIQRGGSGCRALVFTAILPTVLNTVQQDIDMHAPAFHAALFASPMHTLCEDTSASEAGVYTGQYVETKNIRKARVGKKGSRMGEAEEDAWVEELSRELAMKKTSHGHARGKMPTQSGGVEVDPEEIQLAEQDLQRDNLFRRFRRFQSCMQLVLGLMRSSMCAAAETTGALVRQFACFAAADTVLEEFTTDTLSGIMREVFSRCGDYLHRRAETLAFYAARVTVLHCGELYRRLQASCDAKKLHAGHSARKLLSPVYPWLFESFGGTLLGLLTEDHTVEFPSDPVLSPLELAFLVRPLEETIVGCQANPSNQFQRLFQLISNHLELPGAYRRHVDLKLARRHPDCEDFVALGMTELTKVSLRLPLVDKSNVQSLVAATGTVLAVMSPHSQMNMASATGDEEMNMFPNLRQVVTACSNFAYAVQRSIRSDLCSIVLNVLEFSPTSKPSPGARLSTFVSGSLAAAAGDGSSVAGSDLDSALSLAGISPHDGHGAASHFFDPFELQPVLSETGLLSGSEHVRKASVNALDNVMQKYSTMISAGYAVPELQRPGTAPPGFGGRAGGESDSDTADDEYDGRRHPFARWDQLSSNIFARMDHMPPVAIVLRIWMSRHDASSDIAEFATALWNRSGLRLPQAYGDDLVPLLSHPEDYIRKMAGRSVAAAFAEHPTTAEPTVRGVMEVFAKQNQGIGREDSPAWRARCGVVEVLQGAAAYKTVPPHLLREILEFLIAKGLSDSNEVVRYTSLQAGVAFMSAYGPSFAEVITELLEQFLENVDTSSLAGESVDIRDLQREGVIVWLGNVAKHYPPASPKITSTMSTLVEALKTPSESVQRAVSLCLPPLMKMIPSEATSDIVEQLKKRVSRGASYGERRGAAFGLAGCVKGLGLASLKNHNIMPMLERSISEKKFDARQGALFAFECLSELLGLLFEPYVVRILPSLLKCFGEQNNEIRKAAHAASKVIMGQLSGHGVKLVMPALLKGVDESAWRSKVASIEMLGSMAYCAPKQLSSCLPQIVPKLCKAFADVHPKVQAAGQEALKDIGSVIRNPEISTLVPKLVGALSDPSEKTSEALDALANTTFVHAIDPASLALIAPILRKGLQARDAAVKSKAALIVGNMCSLVRSSGDLSPYLPTLLPHLQRALLDPIPETRAVSAKAFGGLIAGLGEDGMPEVIAWMLETLRSSASSAERSGAAQGLCEVLVVLGEPRLSEVLAQVLPLVDSDKAARREALMWVLAFLPTAMGADFAAYIKVMLPLVIQGLSDDDEVVREVALRAGQVVVNKHALTHTSELLPALKDGILDDNWRIRQCSLKLIGDLLMKVGSAKNSGGHGGDNEDMEDLDEEVDSRGDSTAHAKSREGLQAPGGASLDFSSPQLNAIARILGKQNRDEVLGLVFLLRTDASNTVRQTAVNVWKSLIVNTGKTLRLILSRLMTTVVELLASSEPDRRSMSGKCLGDIVKKLGDRVLPEIIPVLREELKSQNASSRQGVCIGLAEVIASCTRRQLEHYSKRLIPAVQDALCDANDDVRKAAAQAFNTLNASLGKGAVGHILPYLLGALDSDDPAESERGMFGIREILAVRAKEVLPDLLPRLLKPPLTAFHASALSAVASASPDQVHYHFNVILPALVQALAGTESGGDQETSMSDVLSGPVAKGASGVVCSVGPAGVNWMLSELLKYTQEGGARVRCASIWLVGEFCGGTSESFESHLQIIYRDLLPRLADPDPDVLKATHKALCTINRVVDADVLAEHLSFVYNHLRSIISDARFRKGAMAAAAASSGGFSLPGFSLPKGLDAILPPFQHGLLKGTAPVREVAARGIGEMVDATDTKSLRPYMLKLTGPLIRVAGEKFPPNVKAAILQSLTLVIQKGGIMVKPFLPQLQTTFVKALNDEDHSVRTRGAAALGRLMQLSPKVDPLVSELCSGASRNAGGVQEAMLDALQSLLRFSGQKVSDAMREKAATLLIDMIHDEKEVIRNLAGSGLGAVVALIPREDAERIIRDNLLVVSDEWNIQHGRTVALCRALRHSRSAMEPFVEDVASLVSTCVQHDNAMVRQAGATVAGWMGSSHSEGAIEQAASVGAAAATRGESGEVWKQAMSTVTPILVKLLSDSSSDVRRAAATALKRIAKTCDSTATSWRKVVVPPLLKAAKDFNLSVKIAAERALLHVFQVYSNDQILNAYLRAVDASTATQVQDYVRKTLKKLTQDSDDDSNDDFAA